MEGNCVLAEDWLGGRVEGLRIREIIVIIDISIVINTILRVPKWEPAPRTAQIGAILCTLTKILIILIVWVKILVHCY